MDNSIIKTIKGNGFKAVIYYDTFSDSPREWRLSQFYGVDKDRPLSLLENKDGKIHISELPQCEELKNKWWALVSKIDHPRVTYYLGKPRDAWDSCHAGIIAVDKVWGDEDEAIELFKKELYEYEHYLNGEVYGFEIINDADEIVDSCGTMYDLNEAECNAMTTMEWYVDEKEKQAIAFWARNND